MCLRLEAENEAKLRLERDLHQSEQLATLGKLASRIVSLPLARALAAQSASGADAPSLSALGERIERYGERRAPKASAHCGPGR
jgi:hypothetical protein